MNTHGSVETRSSAAHAAKPTAVISAPTRLSGRRSQATTPAPMNAQAVSAPENG